MLLKVQTNKWASICTEIYPNKEIAIKKLQNIK